MDALISVIVPAYNVEAYLARCLDSILEQSYHNIEAIVVNDGSQDGTAEILDRYAKKYPNSVIAVHTPNGGVSHARLTGIHEAHGEWIGFMDADDYIEPDMYERLLSNAQKYLADISHCGYRLVMPDEVVYYYNTGRLVWQDHQDALTDLLDGSYIEPGLWNKLFHKSLFQSLLSTELLDMSLRNNEDLLMNYYLFREAESAVYEDFCPYHYILRVGSATTNQVSEHKLKDPIRVMRVLLEETKNNGAQYEAVCRRYIRLLCNTATVPLGEQVEMIRPFRKEIRRELRRLLPVVLLKKHYGNRLKVIALWAGFLPNTYAWVHRVYIRMKNLDKTRSLKK